MSSTTKWSIGIAVAVFVALLVGYGFSSFIIHGNDYNAGLIKGATDGNTSGYQLGLSAGKIAGNSTGYSAGFTAGKNTGLIEGNNTGFKLGATYGKELGLAEGNETGFNAGLKAGSESTGHTESKTSSKVEQMKFDGDSAYALVVGLQNTHPTWFAGHEIKTIRGLEKGNKEYFSIITEDDFDTILQDAKIANDDSDGRASYVTDTMAAGAFILIEDTQGNISPLFATNDDPAVIAIGTWFPKESLSAAYDLGELTNL